MPAQLPGRRALVVDDNETNRRILRAQLEGWGMEVVDHGDPREALLDVLTEGLEVDIAVLDMHMPGMDGATLARGLRDAHGWRRVPLVLLTSLGEQVEEVRSLGMLQLTKPVKAAALRDSLAAALGGASAPRHGRVAEEGVELAPLRILVAEDNEVNRKVAGLMLGRLGQRPDIVGNGQEALEAVRRSTYDLVLMDVQMPVMDGLEATRRIRAELPPEHQPRIVAMTANALVEHESQSLEAGMDDHLTKPVAVLDPAVLDALVSAMGAGGAEVRDRLVAAWGRDADESVQRLGAAVVDGDGARAAGIAHAMKSASASVGALRLSEVCAVLEAEAPGADRSRLAALVARVTAEVAAATSAFERADRRGTMGA